VRNPGIDEELGKPSTHDVVDRHTCTPLWWTFRPIADCSVARRRRR
jgi:hypothetical protein